MAEKRTMEEMMEERIPGRNAVLEALRGQRTVDVLYVQKDARGGSMGKVLSLAKEKRVLIKEVDQSRLDTMSGGMAHQGVLAVVSSFVYADLDDTVAAAKAAGESMFFIIADHIEDPHNLGAIIRSAECVGATGVIIPKRHSASVNATVYKTSAGACQYVKVIRVPNLASAVEKLKGEGVFLYGSDADGADYTTVDYSGHKALVIGSEGFGMSRIIKDKCDFILSIPMYGHINSLNASVAGGVLMFEMAKGRNLG